MKPSRFRADCRFRTPRASAGTMAVRGRSVRKALTFRRSPCIDPPRRCPECASRLDYLGAGTQRVEEAVRHRFPKARVMRWDADAVREHGYQVMLARAEEHQVDIIVGTQMVSKGFDLPRVTTIGVVQADSMLHLPDFRSAERTFQLLTQVAGRAGRRRSPRRAGRARPVRAATHQPAPRRHRAARRPQPRPGPARARCRGGGLAGQVDGGAARVVRRARGRRLWRGSARSAVSSMEGE